MTQLTKFWLGALLEDWRLLLLPLYGLLWLVAIASMTRTFGKQLLTFVKTLPTYVIALVNRRGLTATSLKSKFRPMSRGLAKYWPIAFVGIWCGLVALAITNYQPPASVETHHHVEVLAKLAPNLWEMHDDEQGTFRYTGCPDFPNEKVIWPGYIADRATWREEGNCKSIRATGLGFIWEHDAQGNVKRIGE